jgi:hypothetical protein
MRRLSVPFRDGSHCGCHRVRVDTRQVMVEERCGLRSSRPLPGVRMTGGSKVTNGTLPPISKTVSEDDRWRRCRGRLVPRTDNLYALCKVLKLPVRVTRKIAGG